MPSTVVTLIAEGVGKTVNSNVPSPPVVVLIIFNVPCAGGVGLLTTEHVGFGLVAETVTVQGLPVVIHPVVVSVMVYVPYGTVIVVAPVVDPGPT